MIHPYRDGQVKYRELISCECVKTEKLERRRQAMLNYCELPPMVEGMTFTNFTMRDGLKTAYDESVKIARNHGSIAWLTFMGRNDTGKTHLAVAICRSWVEAGVPAKYVFVPFLLDELRKGYQSKGDDSYEQRFKTYCDVPLLLLDDLGAESRTPWAQEKMDMLVDYRYMNNKSLIVTTNNKLEELPARIRSRLVRHPASQIIAIQAADYTFYKKQRK
jgi:DNA replication protein DnaC